MELTTTKGKKIEFYSSIKEMPARVLLQFQIHLSQHMGIGSTMEELDNRLSQMRLFLESKRTEDALKEMDNLRLGYYLLLEKIDTRAVAAACLVKSIDGMPVTVQTDEQVMAVHKVLLDEEITDGELEELVFGLKKKLTAS